MTTTTTPTAQEIKAYFRTISADRIKLSDVREEFRPAVAAYQETLSHLGTSWVGLNNAMVAALATSAEAQAKKASGPRGNCPRCGGEGFFKGFSHVHNGRCFKCEGTGNI